MAITFSLLPSGLVASAVGIENVYRKNGRVPAQQRIALLGQYLSTKTPTNNLPVAVTTADDVAALAGYGSQAHMMALSLFAEMGASPILVDWFPIADGTTAKVYTITFSGAAGSQGVWRVYILGKKYEISVLSGDTAIASATALTNLINADQNCVFTAANGGTAVCTITAKWKGLSSDLLDVRKNYVASDVNLVPSTQTMVIASSVSGASDPSLSTALGNFGQTFYTMIVTALNDTTAAAAIEATFTARIDPLVKMPVFGVLGYVDTRANFITAMGSRNNPGSVYFPVEGSPSHPGQISAAIVGMIAPSAASDPARPFKNLVSKTLLPGTGAAWTVSQANAVELAGGSAFKVNAAGQVSIFDLVTTYKTNGAGALDISWQYPEAITNTQRKLFDLDTMLSSAPFDRAKIISDSDIAASEYALSPKKIGGYFIDLYEQWVAANWSTSRDTMAGTISVEVDGSNPSRINVEFTDYMVVGLRVMAVKRNWALGAA